MPAFSPRGYKNPATTGEINDPAFWKTVGENQDARWLEAAEDSEQAKQDAATALGTLGAVRALAKQANQSAASSALSSSTSAAASNAAADTVERFGDDVELLKQMGGVSPGSVTDAQTALLIQDQQSETHARLNAQIDEASPTYSANKYGASPSATWEVNRDAFNAAISAASAFGGGRVVAKPGTYTVKGIVQDARVELHLPGVTLVSPDGQMPEVIIARTRTTTATTTKGLNQVSVASTAGIEVGAVVAIAHVGGMLDTQNTYLTANLTASSTDLTLGTAQGFPSAGVLAIEDELVTYASRSGTTLGGVVRGAFGTTPAPHLTQSTIPAGYARQFYATVETISGNILTLDKPVPMDATGVTLTSGILAPGLTEVTVDGNAPAQGATASVVAVSWPMVRHGVVNTLNLRDTDHGGFMLLKGARDNQGTNLSFHNCGIPSVGKGSALWLYQGANNNHISGVTITGDTYVSIYLDDRTASADGWDHSTDDNTLTGIHVDANTNPDKPTAALNIVAGHRNRLGIGSIKGAVRMFSIGYDHQGVRADGQNTTATGNEVFSLTGDVSETAWIAEAGGNVIHDVDYKAAYDPMNSGGNLVYASRLKASEPITLGDLSFPNGTVAAPGVRFASDPDTGWIWNGDGVWSWVSNKAIRLSLYGQEARFSDGMDIATGTTTGTKIGRTASQKIGFFGRTPTIQPAGPAQSNGATVAELEINLNQMILALRTLGLIAQ